MSFRATQNLRARGNTGSGGVPSPLNEMDAPQGGWTWEDLVSSVYVSEEVEWFCWKIPDLTAGQHAHKHRDLKGGLPVGSEPGVGSRVSARSRSTGDAVGQGACPDGGMFTVRTVMGGDRVIDRLSSSKHRTRGETRGNTRPNVNSLSSASSLFVP